MHDSIHDRLEDYLSGHLAAEEAQRFEKILAGDSSTRALVTMMKIDAMMIRRTLHVEEIDPAPGFYARVMARIESQGQPSFWEQLLSPFGNRLVYAGMALLLVAGAMVLSDDSVDTASELMASSPAIMLQDEPADWHLVGDQTDDDRDRMLVHLSTFETPIQ